MRRNESGLLGTSAAGAMLPEAGKARRSWRDGWTSALCRCRQPPDAKQQKQRRLALGCLLSLVAATLLLASSGVVGWLMETPMRNPGRVLLVTAHPDDEVIFFASTVTALHSSGLEVFLLCLTNGDAHGLGDLRERELRAAAAALQIDKEHLTILNDTRIQDGHHEDWEEEYVAHIVRDEVLRQGINTIITFDANGVTGHLNHEGCYNGVRHYITDCARSSQAKRAGGCPGAWALATTDDFRTFSSVLDVLPSAVEARRDADAAMLLNHDLPAMFRAMAAHKSQSRWWRHVLLTRYTFVNTLERIKPLATDWTLPLQTPAGARAGEDSHSGSQGLAAAAAGARTSSPAGAETVHKRSAFQMRRISRATLRNSR